MTRATRPDGTNRTALITGASSGIGESFAELFSANGFDLVVAARREDRLRRLAERLERTDGGRVHVVPVDLSRPEASVSLCSQVETRGLTIDALVNNAGYGLSGHFLAQPWERHVAQLQVMVVALAELTYRLLPGMTARGYGRIVNVASLAGLAPAPAGHTLYPASKAFAIKFSEALAEEVRPAGVHVTALCPGFTRSEFHDVTGTRAQVDTLPAWLWMDAPDVARQGFDAVMNGTPVCITGGVNRAIARLVRYAPRPVVMWAGRRLSRSYRKT